MFNDRKVRVVPTVQIGEAGVTVIRKGQTRHPGAAEILGSETDPATGLRTIWLDRLAHREGEDEFDEAGRKWRVTGAISTVMREQAAQQ